MSPWTILAGVLLLGGAFAGGYYEGHHQEQNVLTAQVNAIKAADAVALAKSEADARSKEQSADQHLAVITQTYEQDKANAKAQSDNTIASLRAGTLRLRSEFNCTPALAASVSAASSSGSSTPTADQLREQDAANIVRAAADADAEIMALQKVIQEDRAEVNGK
jgi:hypothetical protein